MSRTFVIAEPAATWEKDRKRALRLIDCVKECGADCIKFEWTSNGRKIAERRGMLDYAQIYEDGIQFPFEWLEEFKDRCKTVGLEFMCTTYLIEDIVKVAPLVRYFKISAFESQWREFVSAHCQYDKPAFISVRKDQKRLSFCRDTNWLYVVSKYPTKMQELELRNMKPFDGLSDHTADVLTGALAVARGAPAVEAHVKLYDTPRSNPDYKHSLCCDDPPASEFTTYVRNIRTAEVAL